MAGPPEAEEAARATTVEGDGAAALVRETSAADQFALFMTEAGGDGEPSEGVEIAPLAARAPAGALAAARFLHPRSPPAGAC